MPGNRFPSVHPEAPEDAPRLFCFCRTGEAHTSHFSLDARTIQTDTEQQWGHAFTAVTPDSRLVCVAFFERGKTVLLDVASQKVVKTISLAGLISIPPDGRRAYVTQFEGNSVSVIDLFTLEVTGTIQVGKTPYMIAMTPDGKMAYVTNNGDDTVSVIDTALQEVVETIPSGRWPGWIGITPEGRSVYVANGDRTVSVLQR